MGQKKDWFEKDISGCSLTGFICEDGKRVNGEAIIQSIASMNERSNGLGGGFAAYGIYPEMKDFYAFHILYEDKVAKEETERVLNEALMIEFQEKIPTRKTKGIHPPPLLMRYFVSAEEYEGYIWIAHGRFPTNTPGWWGGAHPFTLLDFAVVHNGEISSYGINKRYLEMFGYKCTLMTDKEVMAYLFDLLLRRHRLPIELACKAMAPPTWTEIDRGGKEIELN